VQKFMDPVPQLGLTHNIGRPARAVDVSGASRLNYRWHRMGQASCIGRTGGAAYPFTRAQPILGGRSTAAENSCSGHRLHPQHELIELVARHFDCSRSAVSIKRGDSSRLKLVKIESGVNGSSRRNAPAPTAAPEALLCARWRCR
jgi:hypothetical protein